MKINLLCRISKKFQTGFSLTEGLVGVAVMGTVFLSLYSGMANGFQTIRNSQENVRATQILLEKFETIRLYNWDQINDPSFIPPTFTVAFAPNDASKGVTYRGRVTISNNSPISEAYGSDMRSVRIDLVWTSNGLSHSRTFTSYVARYGLQNYIY